MRDASRRLSPTTYCRLPSVLQDHRHLPACPPRPCPYCFSCRSVSCASLPPSCCCPTVTEPLLFALVLVSVLSLLLSVKVFVCVLPSRSIGNRTRCFLFAHPGEFFWFDPLLPWLLFLSSEIFGGSYPSADSRLHASLICYFRYWIVNVLGPLTYTKHDTYLY